MLNAGLNESKGGIKVAKRNINNLRYEDNTTLMAKSEEELKSLLMKEKEESEKPDLKLNIHKTKIMAFGPTSLWPIEGEKVETVTDFIFIAIGPGSVSGLGTKILVCLKKKNKQTNKKNPKPK